MKRDAPPQVVQDIFEPNLSALLGILVMFMELFIFLSRDPC